MKVLVCIKQVPDSGARLEPGADAREISPQGVVWAISPFDEYAIELALEIKDAAPDTTVSVVSIGPARAVEALRQALAQGCDDALLIDTDVDPGCERIARELADYARAGGYDVVLCGQQAGDDELGIVGPVIADILGWPQLSMAVEARQIDDGLEVTRQVEGGIEVWEAYLPVMVTVHRSCSEPRYPSLPNILRVRRQEIPTRPLVADSALSGWRRTELLGLEPPAVRGAGTIVTMDGDPDALARDLVRRLREEARVL